MDGLLQGSDEEEEEEAEAESGSNDDDDDEEEEEEEDASESEDDGGAADPLSRKQLRKGEDMQQAALRRLEQQQPPAHKPQKGGAAAAAGEGAAEGEAAEVPLGTTVFVRGLPLDVTKEQLYQKMKVRALACLPGEGAIGGAAGQGRWRRELVGARGARARRLVPLPALPRHTPPGPVLPHLPQTFGPLRSCRLVVDKASSKLKGTAFVEYYSAAGAQAAATACAKGRRARMWWQRGGGGAAGGPGRRGCGACGGGRAVGRG